MEKMEPGSDNELDLTVRTSVAKQTQVKIQHTSIMKWRRRRKEKEKKKCVITHIFETTRGYHEAGPCT